MNIFMSPTNLIQRQQIACFRLRFTLKNRHYSPHEIYYLVAYDEQTGLEVKRREMVIDIAFVNDLGF